MKVIFLSYINRSGSTFLINQLSKYPEIAVCPEADILYDWLLVKPNRKVTPAWLQRFVHALELDAKWQTWKIQNTGLDAFEGTRLELFLDLLERFKKRYFQSTEFIVFKHNSLWKLIGYQEYSNRFKWLNLVRNPYAIYGSQKGTISPATGKMMCSNPMAFVEAWNTYFQSVDLYGEIEEVSTIFYEDLLTDLGQQMADISGFLGIKTNWETVKERTGAVSEWLNSDYKEIHQSIDRDPISNYTLKWKSQLSQVEIGIISNRLYRNLKYKAENSNVSVLIMQKALLQFRFQRKSMYIRNWMRNQLNSHD